MQVDYKETKTYWNQIFKKEDLYDPFVKLPYQEIEKAIKWLCRDSEL